MVRKSVKRIVVPLGILVLAALGFGALMATKPKSQAAPREETIWSVAAQEVVLTAAQPMLTLYGRIETPRRSRLEAAIEATVASVPVKEGTSVAAGQLLVALEGRETSARLAQREAEVREAEAALSSEQSRYENDRRALRRERELYELAQSEVKRVEDLLRRNLGSESQRDAARQNLIRQRLAVENREQSIADHANRQAQLMARLERARAQLDLARLDHQRTRIVAPFAGRIARVAVSPGDRVRPGETVVEIYDTTALEARAQLPDRYLETVRRALQNGDPLPAESRVDGRVVKLRLDRLAGEVTAGSGGVDALFQVDDEGGWLAVGRFVTLRLTLPPRENALALPREAIYGRNRIYRIVEGRLAPLEVTRLGSHVDNEGREQILVSHPDLAAGDLVLTTQLPNAVEGLRVQIVQKRG